VRYFALRWLLRRDDADAEVRAARADVMESGPVPAILACQHPRGTGPPGGKLLTTKCSSTGWQPIFLSGLGAGPADERIQRAFDGAVAHEYPIGLSLVARSRASKTLLCGGYARVVLVPAVRNCDPMLPRTRRNLVLENLALRHQLAVHGRSRRRPPPPLAAPPARHSEGP
jgi:hypothetical protein